MTKIPFKKVIVIGGGGFLGSHFVEYLTQFNTIIICVDRYFSRDFKKQFLINGKKPINLIYVKMDFLNFPYINKKKVFKEADLIINCGVMDGNAEYKMQHVAEILDHNIKITSNVLNLSRDYKIKNVVLISSAEICSAQLDKDIYEEDDYTKHNDFVMNGYVLSKRYAEILGVLYENQYRMNVFSPRLTNVYGPRDHFADKTTRVIPNIIKNIHNDKEIQIWGDGSQIRQFIYVRDAVRAILNMVEKNKYHKLNIANKEAVTIINLAKSIAKISKKKEKIFLDKTKPVGAKSRILDISKLLSVINFKFKSLEDGLSETIDWYVKNYDKDNKNTN